MAVHGDSAIGIRWAPASAGTGKRRFKCIGSSSSASCRPPCNGDDILYTFAIRGNVEDETIS